jgi:hypothetical protein
LSAVDATYLKETEKEFNRLYNEKDAISANIKKENEERIKRKAESINLRTTLMKDKDGQTYVNLKPRKGNKRVETYYEVDENDEIIENDEIVDGKVVAKPKARGKKNIPTAKK